MRTTTSSPALNIKPVKYVDRDPFSFIRLKLRRKLSRGWNQRPSFYVRAKAARNIRSAFTADINRSQISLKGRRRTQHSNHRVFHRIACPPISYLVMSLRTNCAPTQTSKWRFIFAHAVQIVIVCISSVRLVFLSGHTLVAIPTGRLGLAPAKNDIIRAESAWRKTDLCWPSHGNVGPQSDVFGEVKLLVNSLDLTRSKCGPDSSQT
jgi:hypothetical protein